MPTGVNQESSSELRASSLTPDYLASGGVSAWASRNRRLFLGRSDLAPLLVAFVTVGYTLFALVQGPAQEPRPSDSGQPGDSLSLSVLGQSATGPVESRRAALAEEGGGTGEGGSSRTGPAAVTQARAIMAAGAAGTGPVEVTTTRAASGSGTPTGSSHRELVSDHKTVSTSSRSAPTPESVVPATVPVSTTAAPATTQRNVPSGGAVANPLTAGTAGLVVGSTVSLRATTACCTTHYLRGQFGMVVTSVITPYSSIFDKYDATWVVRNGLSDSSCVSLESRNQPGSFLRHSNFRVYRQRMDGTALFRADATFCPLKGQNGTGVSFASFNYPTKFLRHYQNALYIASNDGSNAWDSSAFWGDDVSWMPSSPWVP